VEVVVKENHVRVSAAETVFIPGWKAWRMVAESVWAKWYIFANGSGIGEVMMGVGGAYEWAVVGEGGDVRAWDRGKFAGLQKEFKLASSALVHRAFPKKDVG
jgi:hypothetical protein